MAAAHCQSLWYVCSSASRCCCSFKRDLSRTWALATQIRRLLHQLLDAIAYCHRRGVLHRNLKPKHLLIKTSNADTLGTS